MGKKSCGFIGCYTSWAKSPTFGLRYHVSRRHRHTTKTSDSRPDWRNGRDLRAYVIAGTRRYLARCNQWLTCILPRTARNPRSRKSGEQETLPIIRYMLISCRLIKRATIVGRLFYHTAMCLLPQIHPLMPKEVEEMRTMQLHHAHQICGIVAHVKDRGVASVALRSLAIAAECLVIHREQEEVLEIFEKIRTETGWKVGFLHKELKTKWGWQQEDQAQHQMAAQQNSLAQFFPSTTQAPSVSLPSAPPPPMPMPSRIQNPLERADYSLPNPRSPQP